MGQRRKIYYKRKYKRRSIRYKKVIFFLVVILFIFIFLKFVMLKLVSLPYDKISDFLINPKIIMHIKNYCYIKDIDTNSYLSGYMIDHNYEAKNYNNKDINRYLETHKFYFSFFNKKQNILSQIYKKGLADVKCFPISSGNNEYNYVDSWKAKRTYGGDRPHLGTDIMDCKNEPGRLKIISMTDGYIENLGWNEYGGWRVGVKSPEGTYFYYAHLKNYAEGLKKGKQIKAGELLGYMGNTGYGKQPGTSGKFDVHLHVGIMLNGITEEEYWVNPYYILKYAEYIK